MHSTADPDGPSSSPAHPGVLLGEQLRKQGIKPSAFALQLGTYPSIISDLIKGKRSVSAAMAIRLEEALGIPAQDWMRMQADYELAVERSKGK
jgi:addiction module HigA family antidote